MGELFRLEDFDQYKEDNRREVKRSKGGIPVSVWETYSSFANCYGGVIILGIDEQKDKSWRPAGLTESDADKLIKDFWDIVNNRQKVSINILKDSDITSYTVDDSYVVVITVPMARREDKPVYLNGDLLGGAFRRNGEGDYRCSQSEVKAMLRDAADSTMDNKIIDHLPLSAIDKESLHSYRNRYRAWKPGHVWENDTDEDFLVKIGAAAILKEDGQLHPTAAGLLMFGQEYNITREFPHYFLDYREMLDPSIRWTDRLQSSSGDWTGNIMDFFYRVYNKVQKDIKVPFALDGIVRVDDTPVHKAVREALVNCLVNADYYQPRGVVVKKDADTLVIENPGSIRTGKNQMLRGGISDPRNETILKMFNLIGYGERAGSGVPDIYSVWEKEGWEEPSIVEQYGPDRTILTLSFRNRLSAKTVDKKPSIKNVDKKPSIKTVENQNKIRQYLKIYGESTNAAIASAIGLSTSRTKEILRNMEDVAAVGDNKNRKYRLIDKQ